MILESTQLLWTAHWVTGTPPPPDAPIAQTTGQPGYRPVSRNHPCAIWTRETIGNYRWLIALSQHLIAEYHLRWPTQRNAHACEIHIKWLSEHEPTNIPNLPMTMPAQAMPVQFKRQSPTAAYKAYYLGAKSHFARWTNRTPPVWWSEALRTPAVAAVAAVS